MKIPTGKTLAVIIDKPAFGVFEIDDAGYIDGYAVSKLHGTLAIFVRTRDGLIGTIPTSMVVACVSNLL
jgi:hypothetical protein